MEVYVFIPKAYCAEEKMKLIRQAFGASSNGLLHPFRRPLKGWALSTNAASVHNDNQNADSFESADDFEKRIFEAPPKDGLNPLLKTFHKPGKPFGQSGLGSEFNGRNKFGRFDYRDDSITMLSDGMEEKLRDAATYFKMTNEIEEDDFTFRPDINFQDGGTYETKDLDLTKPGVWNPSVQDEFQVTSAEVLQQADFRNIRFLANFITDAGIIIKRSKTKISAKAQRKVAREIKTARAFGLLPFTTMGTKAFVCGRTMQNLDEDYEHYISSSSVIAEEDAPQAKEPMQFVR
ncbi:hypothetical protein Dimus_022098 [Dionaea muscipula]